MSRELKKEKLELGSLAAISGGVVGVSIGDVCCKPGKFEVLKNKENEWRQNDCPEKCQYCWHLKFNNGFYCDC